MNNLFEITKQNHVAENDPTLLVDSQRVLKAGGFSSKKGFYFLCTEKCMKTDWPVN